VNDQDYPRSVGRSHGPTQPPRPRRGAGLALLGLVVTGLAVAVGLAVGVALWTSQAQLPAGSLTAGDMTLTKGALTWRQVTPGVASPSAGSLASTPPGFVTMPGDVVELRLPVTTFLRGDNLVAELTIDYRAPAQAGDIDVTFRIENAAGGQVAPATGQAPAGVSVTVPGLEGNDAGVTQQWTVVLTVEVLGDYQWVTPASPAAAVDWTAGTVVAALVQVRPAPTASGVGG